MATGTASREDSREQFEKTDSGWQKRWCKELKSSEKMLEKTVEQGEKIVLRYLDKRETSTSGKTRLNLFHSGINTLKAMLYGQVPKVDFDRRYADPDDDVARVASEMYERMLNADIERPDDDYTAVLQHCLMDRLLPGMAIARVRYNAEFEVQEVPAVTDELGNELAPAVEQEVLTREQALIDYVHWKDFRYSYARTWNEVRWVAFREYMDYDALEARFGEDLAKQVPLSNQTPDEDTTDITDAWQKGEVWEIWDKESRQTFWVCEGMDVILDKKPDPLELRTFFPCPKPMLANCTTNLLIPRADFVITQDLYNDIDMLQSRIRVLSKAIRVVGAYDKSNPEIKRILTDAGENEMVPVENWAMFSEKKGLDGAVSWFPLEMVVNTLDKLRELRDEQIALLYQITGLSDIMRGQSSGSDRVSATEQSIKAKFASVRVQALQDEFTRFGTDLIRLKGEVVARHFQVENIIKASNVMLTPDAELAGQAVELIKNQEDFVWRVFVRPESMAMVDYQALQAERSGYLAALAQFLQSGGPLIETMPQAAPVLLQMLQWGLAGFKGSAQIEGVLDRAIADLKNNPPQQKPDPAAEKAKVDMQMKQAELQADMQKMQAEMKIKIEEAQQELAMEREKHMMELQFMREKHMLEMQMKREELGLKREETQQKLETQAVLGQQQLMQNEQLGQQKVEQAKAQSNDKKKLDR